MVGLSQSVTVDSVVGYSGQKKIKTSLKTSQLTAEALITFPSPVHPYAQVCFKWSYICSVIAKYLRFKLTILFLQLVLRHTDGQCIIFKTIG